MSPPSNITSSSTPVFILLFFFYPVVESVTCAKEKECEHIGHLELLSLANVMLLYFYDFLPFFHSPLDHC